MASNVNCLGSDPPTSNLSELCSENINSKILLSPSENMQVETVGSINRNSDDIAVYKEKDHLYCLAENLKAFREANILCDVEINLGREQILAHKCVLAACSKKLKMMLSGDEHQHSRHSVDLSAEPSLFLNLLDYLYTGSLSICIDSIGELLNLAKYLEIENVCHLCCRHLEEVVNVENWSVIFDLATSLDLDSVKKSINTFASHHFLYLSSTDSFKDKDYKHFKSIVTHCNPDNDSELEICKIKEILNWINFDESRLVYLKEFLMLTDVQHIQDIAALVRYIDAIDLRQNVVNHTVFKEFIEGIERVKSLPKTLERSSDNEVNTYAPVVISPKIKNLHPVESNTKKEQDTNDHATDAHHDSDATVEDYGGISDMDSMTKIKEINPNVPELDEVLEQKNKRKSFRPKRLRSVKQLKLKRSESTNRKRGRPRKTLVTEMRQRKPKMKTSCTQVLAENITEEFEEIEREAREQVEHSDLETAEGDENGIPKLETVDNIVKVEPQAPEDVVRKTTQIIQRLDVCSKRPKPKYSTKYAKVGSTVNADPDYEAETEVDDYDPLSAMGEVRKKKKRYKAKKTENGDAEIFQCPRCPRQFYTPSKLKHHMKGHGAAAPMLCEHCGFSTIHFASMNIHRRIHDTSLQFKCTWPGCTYSTIRSNRLQDHIAKHSGVKNHVCSTCGKAYSGRKHLNRHEQSHKEEKLVRCEECNYQSTRRDKLREHIKKHHPGTAIIRGYMHPDDLNKPKPPPRKRPPRVRKPKKPKQPKLGDDVDSGVPMVVEGQMAVAGLQNVLSERVHKDDSMASDYVEGNSSNVLEITEESNDHPQALVTRVNNQSSPQQSSNRVPSSSHNLIHARGHQSTALFQVPAAMLQHAAISEEMLQLLQGNNPGTHAAAFMMAGSQPSGINNAGTGIGSSAGGGQGVGQGLIGSSSEQSWFVMNYPQ